MAPFASEDTTSTAEDPDLRAARRRKAARYVVPVTVIGVAAATIGLVPALADSGDPDLPKISTRELLEKIAASDTQQLSGTVKTSTDLGLPDFSGLGSSLTSGATGSGDGEGSSADPSSKLTELVSGTHTLRVATDGAEKQKLSVLENASEYSLIHNGKDIWGYDSESNEVYHATESDSDKEKRQEKRQEKSQEQEREHDEVPATPQELTEEVLKAADDTTSLTVEGTAQVADRDAYRLVIKPKQTGSTVGQITVAVDAETGLPLKFTLTPSSGGAAVVDAGFTQISYSRPDASTFDFTPPKGAKVTEGDEGKDGKDGKSEKENGEGLDDLKVIGEGWNSVATFDTGSEGLSGDSEGDGDLGGFLDSLSDKVTGKFGSGTLYSTRLINVLLTEDGRVYAGAVSKDALVKAANTDGS